LQTTNYNYKNLFDCEIIYSPKRKRSLCISITPKGVIVRVPVRTSERVIVNFINSKESLILRGLNKLSKMDVVAKKPLIEREVLHFLGEQYLLKISQSKLLKKSGFCEIREGCFYVNLPHSDEQKIISEKLENTIKGWYKKRAFEIFCERTEYLADLHNFEYTKVKIGEQKTLWGSCNHKNNLSFNWKVVQCHIDVIDYLIIHELTHTVHRDHSHRFWGRVGEILPDYKELRRKLKKVKFISI